MLLYEVIWPKMQWFHYQNNLSKKMNKNNRYLWIISKNTNSAVIKHLIFIPFFNLEIFNIVLRRLLALKPCFVNPLTIIKNQNQLKKGWRLQNPQYPAFRQFSCQPPWIFNVWIEPSGKFQFNDRNLRRWRLI